MGIYPPPPPPPSFYHIYSSDISPQTALWVDGNLSFCLSVCLSVSLSITLCVACVSLCLCLLLSWSEPPSPSIALPGLSSSLLCSLSISAPCRGWPRRSTAPTTPPGSSPASRARWTGGTTFTRPTRAPSPTWTPARWALSTELS